MAEKATRKNSNGLTVPAQIKLLLLLLRADTHWPLTVLRGGEYLRSNAHSQSLWRQRRYFPKECPTLNTNIMLQTTQYLCSLRHSDHLSQTKPNPSLCFHSGYSTRFTPGDLFLYSTVWTVFWLHAVRIPHVPLLKNHALFHNALSSCADDCSNRGAESFVCQP